MDRYVLLLFGLCLFACDQAKEPARTTPNRWADERLWPVLDAQEHRDTEALCALLKHEAPEVREAAALAFASVQDTLGIPCLLAALSDVDMDVRRHAVLALGLVADSATVQLIAERSLVEKDSTVQAAYFSASFLALQRNGLLKDLPTVVYYLERSAGQDRVRAADAVRRSRPDVLRPDSTLLYTALERERDPEVRAMLLRALIKANGPSSKRVLWDAVRPGHSAVERIAALQSLAHVDGGLPNDTLVRWSNDPDAMFRAAVHAQLSERAPTSPEEALRWLDILVGLEITAADHLGRSTARTALDALRKLRLTDPYEEAVRIRMLAAIQQGLSDAELKAMLFSDRPAVERQAAFQALAQRTAQRMMMPRAISFDMQLREAAPFWHQVLSSKDAGLICAAAEHLSTSPAGHLTILFPPDVEQQAVASLHPVRDLEAVQLIAGLAAQRDGRTAPNHTAPSFHHPIDKQKLLALKQGQRYRIVTNEGDVIIATDVDDCPGSSLAFDSLVTAGYYNGKAFHRMVPNFVVQGGCPRGDGYGGMPWTLRTEIGRGPFTAGSVGLASAGRDTESCQFFITHSATPHLDGRYTRFGEVVEGMDVVWRLQVGDVMEKVERVE